MPYEQAKASDNTARKESQFKRHSFDDSGFFGQNDNRIKGEAKKMKRFLFALAAIALCIISAFACVHTVKKEIQPMKTNVNSALNAFTSGQKEQSEKYVKKAVESFEESENKLTVFIGSEKSQKLKKDLFILLKLSKQEDKALFTQKAEECLEGIKDIEDAQSLSLVNIL